MNERTNMSQLLFKSPMLVFGRYRMSTSFGAAIESASKAENVSCQYFFTAAIMERVGP